MLAYTRPSVLSGVETIEVRDERETHRRGQRCFLLRNKHFMQSIWRWDNPTLQISSDICQSDQYMNGSMLPYTARRKVSPCFQELVL